MITNPEKIIRKYICKKHVADFLIREGLPLLSCDKDFYYFTDNEMLADKIKKIPFYLKVLDRIR